MSLLMDALKKAEREKNKAAKKDKESGESTPENEALSAKFGDGEPGEEPATEALVKDDASDETWAFDTGELELEPIPIKADSTPEKGSGFEDSAGDITMAEALPLPNTSPVEPVDVDGQQGEDKTIKPEFDHDATLPSERAIQSSLKDYFEASQSITMDQASISGPLSQNTSEHSFTNTSPLDSSATHATAQDSSATHVTAHTIFTASQTRQASTGLLKYAIFGTLFLALGLGAVALYYSAMTPNVIETAPIAIVAEFSEPDLKQSPEVDVTQSPPPPFEPGAAGLVLNAEDPVVASVVDAEKTAQVAQISEAPQANNPIDGRVDDQIDPKTARSRSTAEKKAQSAGQKDSSKDRPTLAFSDAAKQPEASILEAEQRNQSGASQGPLEVMSSKNFSEALTMPKSAIKITRASGKSRRAPNSDLMNAYQAYQAGDYINAKSSYRKVLNGRPDNRDARLGLAAVAVQQGNRETAYRHYQHLLQQNPRDEVVNAAIFSLQGDSAGVVNESQLKILLDQAPDSPQLHFSLGSHYARQSRWAEAQQAFFDAFAANKNNPDYAYNLAVSLDQIGQSKSALGYYRQALKLADNTRVSFNTSKVLARIQQLSGLAAH